MGSFKYFSEFKTEWISIILTILGLIIAVYGYGNSESGKIGIACIVCAQVLVVFAWCFVFYTKIQLYKKIGFNRHKVKLLNNKLRKCEQELNEKGEFIVCERENIVKQHKKIANAIKSNSIHSNTMLKRIPAEAEKQYKLIEILSKSNSEGMEESAVDAEQNYNDSANVLMESLDQFRDTLYSLFKQHCREVTNEAKKLQTALLALKGYDYTISITVKLMVNPYNSDSDRMHDMSVYTAFRDNESYEEKQREIGIELYTIAGNTDFMQCLTEENFIINNATGDDRNYRNENRGFPDHYNCAVVVPIRIKRVGGDFKLFGFLCCDCLSDQKAEVFDEINAEYLFAMGQNLATFLETLDSNWVDRTQDLEESQNNILLVLHKKIYKGKGQAH